MIKHDVEAAHRNTVQKHHVAVETFPKDSLCESLATVLKSAVCDFEIERSELPEANISLRILLKILVIFQWYGR